MGILRRSKHVSSQELKALLSSFESGTKINENGGITYELHDFGELYEILPDAFHQPPDLTPRQLREILRRALLDCRIAGTMNEAALMARADEIGRTTIAVRPTTFTLWTKLRSRKASHLPGFSLAWDGVRIKAVDRLPRTLDRDEYFINGFGRVRPREPHSFSHIVLSCLAKDEDGAVTKMLDALHVFMGLTNMYLAFGSWSFHTNRNETDGKLWLGEYQFVFRGRLFLSDERVWYNPDFHPEAWDLFPVDRQKLLKVMPHVRRALRALAEHPLRSVLVKVLLLMQDGMASRDGNHRLLRYWSALEQLYGEGDAAHRNYQRIIQRASFPERDPCLERWKLSHAARLRNEYVHAGGHDDDLQASCQHLRHLLSRHVNWLIMKGQDFRDHNEFLEFADLPGDAAKLEKKVETISRRLEMMKLRDEADEQD